MRDDFEIKVKKLSNHAGGGNILQYTNFRDNRFLIERTVPYTR